MTVKPVLLPDSHAGQHTNLIDTVSIKRPCSAQPFIGRGSDRHGTGGSTGDAEVGASKTQEYSDIYRAENIACGKFSGPDSECLLSA